MRASTSWLIPRDVRRCPVRAYHGGGKDSTLYPGFFPFFPTADRPHDRPKIVGGWTRSGGFHEHVVSVSNFGKRPKRPQLQTIRIRQAVSGLGIGLRLTFNLHQPKPTKTDESFKRTKEGGVAGSTEWDKFPCTLVATSNPASPECPHLHGCTSIQYSVFNIQYSAFTIQHSLFNIQHSAFTHCVLCNMQARETRTHSNSAETTVNPDKENTKHNVRTYAAPLHTNTCSSIQPFNPPIYYLFSLAISALPSSLVKNVSCV